MHIGRGLYYGSYTKIIVCNVGVVIFLLLIATASIGYVPLGSKCLFRQPQL